MEKFLATVCGTLRNLGYDATVEYDAIICDGVQVRAWAYRRPKRVEWCGSIFSIAYGRFDVAAATLQFVQKFPQLKADHERRQVEYAKRMAKLNERQRLEAELAIKRAECEAALEPYKGYGSKLIAVLGYVVGDAYVGTVDGQFVTFMLTDDGGRALIAADYLSEMMEKHR